MASSSSTDPLLLEPKAEPETEAELDAAADEEPEAIDEDADADEEQDDDPIDPNLYKVIAGYVLTNLEFLRGLFAGVSATGFVGFVFLTAL